MSGKSLIPTFVEAESFEKLEVNGVEKALRTCYAAKAVNQDLVDGAGRMPPKKFYNKSLDLEDNENFSVVDYGKFGDAPSGFIDDVAQGLEHPQVIPCLGGQRRAKQYLQEHPQVYYSTMGVCHCDDKPPGGVMFLGSGHNHGSRCQGEYVHVSPGGMTFLGSGHRRRC